MLIKRWIYENHFSFIHFEKTKSISGNRKVKPKKENSDFSFYCIWKKKSVFFSLTFLYCIFYWLLFFCKKKWHNSHVEFPKCFSTVCEISKHTAIAPPRKNRNTAIETARKNEKITYLNSKRKSREKWWETSIYQPKQLEYQKEMEQNKLKYQKEMEEKQLEFEKQGLEPKSRGNSIENEFSLLQNIIWVGIFLYSPGEDVIFASCFRRYKDLYKTDSGNMCESKKIRLLSKLKTNEHTELLNYILPQMTCKLTFTEVIELLMEHFTPMSSLFHKRWKCLNLTRKKGEDFTTFASVVNSVTISDLQS